MLLGLKYPPFYDLINGAFKLNYTALHPWRVISERHEYKDAFGSDVFLRVAEAVEKIHGKISFEVAGIVDDHQQACIAGVARMEVDLVCQRCLDIFKQTFEVPLRWIPVRNEDELQAVGDDEAAILIEDGDVFDLVAAIEDELLLALPMIPVHSDEAFCQGREFLQQQTLGQVEKENPFAMLSKLLEK